jgi:fructose-bisphosphate aldolase class I
MSDLKNIAQELMADGKGILAADESNPTMTKRLDAIGVESTPENRRKFRNALFSTKDMNKHISGVILFEETLEQLGDDGLPIPSILAQLGVLTGIKVDKGTKPWNDKGEKITEGLDGLADRLDRYRELGARFTKWRAVLSPGTCCHISKGNVEANAYALARYARISQQCGLVPIVEPEIIMDHELSIDRVFSITREVLHTTFDQLFRLGVNFNEMILKPNMVLPGYQSKTYIHAPTASSLQLSQELNDLVAEKTVQCLLDTVPGAVPGIAFLSGGQSDHDANDRLNKINKIAEGAHCPWRLTFSYGRGLQQPALKEWDGTDATLTAVQEAFCTAATRTGTASEGKLTL